MGEPTSLIALTREAFPEPGWLDTAVSLALLRHVAAGLAPATLRLFRPSSVLAFGPSDRLHPGYGAACTAARAAGYVPVERLAGGHAAVFHEGTIAFAWAVPDATPRAHVHDRFREISEIMTIALRHLGVDARTGAVAGEYCPGDYSVNARGVTKLVGVGQRLLPRGAHVGGVVVVSGSNRIREILTPVNRALALDWDPAAVGSIEDELGTVSWDSVAACILDAFRQRFDLTDSALDRAVIQQAWTLRGEVAADEVLQSSGIESGIAKTTFYTP